MLLVLALYGGVLNAQGALDLLAPADVPDVPGASTRNDEPLAPGPDDRGPALVPAGPDQPPTPEPTATQPPAATATATRVPAIPTATARPAATPAPAGGIADIVCRPEYSWSCGIMLALIQCESGGNAQAIGAEWYEGRLITFGGWFQDTNGTGDPATDTARAYQKWLAWQRGEVPDPWPNC